MCQYGCHLHGLEYGCHCKKLEFMNMIYGWFVLLSYGLRCNTCRVQ